MNVLCLKLGFFWHGSDLKLFLKEQLNKLGNVPKNVILRGVMWCNGFLVNNSDFPEVLVVKK